MNNTFKANTKVIEKVNYKGELRIIGLVTDIGRDVNFTPYKMEYSGFLILDEVRRLFKAYTIAQTKMLLNRFKFVNAELNSDNNIEFTECSINRLPIYNCRLQLDSMAYDSHITVLGKITYFNSDTTINKKLFKVIDSKLKIADITEDELIKMVNTGSKKLVNAKLVTKTGGSYISAIKQEFTDIYRKIETVKPDINDNCNNSSNKIEENIVVNTEESIVVNTEKTPERKYIEGQHIKNLEKWLKHVIMKSLGIDRYQRDSKWFTYKELTISNNRGYTIDFKKEVKIIITEVLPKYIINKNDLEIINQIPKKLTISPILNRDYVSTVRDINEKDDTVLLSMTLAQFLLNDKTIFNEILHKSQGSNYDARIFNALFELDLVSENYKLLMREHKKLVEDTIKLFNNSDYKDYGYLDYDLMAFNKEIYCEQIGFTLSEKCRGIQFTTKFGNEFNLKYIGDYFLNRQSEYEEYLKKINCLGDVLILAQVEKLINVTYFSLEEKKARLEIMLAILALYRPDIVKEYLSNNGERLKRLSLIDNVEDILPGLSLDSITDFKLSEDLKIYYASGFNVFLSDQGYKDYNKELNGEYTKKKYYKRMRYACAEYINYRTLPIKQYCQHPMLYEELGAIVNLITSDNVDADIINKTIGGLRLI